MKRIMIAKMSNTAATVACICIGVGTRTEAANSVMKVARAVVEKQAARQLRMHAGLLCIKAMVENDVK
jgi:hypothetical protein